MRVAVALGVGSMATALYRDFPDDDGKLASDARNIDYCRAAVDPARLIFSRPLFGSMPIFAAFLNRQARYDGFDHGKLST